MRLTGPNAVQGSRKRQRSEWEIVVKMHVRTEVSFKAIADRCVQLFL